MATLDLKSVTDRTIYAGVWVIASKLISKVIDFATLLILARFLTPGDFGLVAVAMTSVLIVEAVFELPLAAALIRVPRPTDDMFATAFTLGLIRGLVVASVLGAIAWPLSYFYNDQRLFALTCGLATAPILRGMASPRMIIYAQAFDFRRDFLIEVTGKITALACAVALVIATRSYWAIAAATVAGPAAMLVLSYALAPQKLRFTLVSWHHFAEIVRWNTVSQVIIALNWQIDKIVLPRYVSLASFGRFSTAFDISFLPYLVMVQPTTRPLLAAFSAISNSPVALAKAYNKAAGGFVVAIAPILLVISCCSEAVIDIVLGDNWIVAAPILQWLSLINIILLPTIPLVPLAMTLDKTRMITMRVGAELLTKLPLVVVGIIYYGIPGAIFGRGIASVVGLLVAFVAVKKITECPIHLQVQAIWRPMAALLALACYIFVFQAYFWTSGVNWKFDIVMLLFVSATGLIIYHLALFFLWKLSNCPDGIEKTIAERFASLSRKIVKTA